MCSHTFTGSCVLSPSQLVSLDYSPLWPNLSLVFPTVQYVIILHYFFIFLAIVMFLFFLLSNNGPLNGFSVSLKFLPSSLLQGLNVYSYIGEYFVIFLFCKLFVYTFKFSFGEAEFFLWICECSWIFSPKSCPKLWKYVLPFTLLPLSRVCQLYKNSMFYLK